MTTVKWLNSIDNLPQIAVLTLTRLSTSTYVSMLPPLLPFFVVRFGLSFSDAGLLYTALTTLLHVTQPIYGYLSDRAQGLWYIWLGALITPIAIGLMGLASEIWMLYICLVVGGMATAMLRPKSYALIGQLATERKSFIMGVFSGTGLVASALAPIVVVPVVTSLGLPSILLLSVPGLLVVVPLFRALADIPPHTQPAARRGFSAALGSWKKPFAFLFSVAVLHGLLIATLLTFLPLLFQDRGSSELMSGLALTVFFCGGIVGLPIGGLLADRIGFRWLIAATYFSAIPVGVVFLQLRGVAALSWLFVYGITMFGSDSAVIVAGQRMLPAYASTASSLLIGLAWGLGALFPFVFGLFADYTSLTQAFYVLALVPTALAGLCALLLPDRIAPTPMRPATDEV